MPWFGGVNSSSLSLLLSNPSRIIITSMWHFVTYDYVTKLIKPISNEICRKIIYWSSFRTILDVWLPFHRIIPNVLSWKDTFSLLLVRIQYYIHCYMFFLWGFITVFSSIFWDICVEKSFFSIRLILIFLFLFWCIKPIFVWPSFCPV